MPLQIPVTQTGLEASIQQAMRNAGRNTQLNLGTNSRQINALAQPLGRITGQADEFTKSMEAANARVFAFGASVGIINGVTKAFSSLVKNTIEVEKSLVEINTVLNTSGDSLQKFGNKLFDVAKTTGQTFDVVAKGALELARQGLSTEETLKRINDALILSRLSGLDAQQSVEGLTAAFNSFKETGITTSQILNKLVVVSQKYSVSERDLIEGLKRSASVADQAGVSFDELVGIITTVQERTARGGAVIGNAFKTIFARIQDTGALQDLANLGIQVTDLEGKILPATKILQNLGSEFNNLSQLEQADIAKKLGGVYQLSNLLAAVKDLSSEQSKYNDIVKLSAGASNEAYQKNAALNETLAALINKVSVSAQQLGATLGAIGITDNLKSLLDFFNKILEGIQGILGEESMLGDMFRGLAKGIGGVLAGPGLALFGAIIAKLSKDLIGFGIESLKSFFKIGQAAKDIASVEKSIAAALGSNLTLQRQLFALEGNRAAQIKLMTDAIVQQEAVMRRMASTAGSLAGPLYQQGVRSSGGQGLRVPRSAGGYMPAVSQESRDISRGVGGAKSGDKPVVIPNFAFGGGKRGSMVAHTGEFIVPNFAAGGSAIFNRDMVRSMGLPAGAQKINAAGGFIPNFASLETQSTKVLEKYAAGIGRDITPEKQNAAKAILQQRKGSKLPLDQLIPINKSGKDFAMIVGMKGVKDFQNRFGDDQGRITSTQTEKSRYLIGVPIRGIRNKELQFKESKKINEELSEIAGKEALQMAKALSGGAMPNPDNLKSIKESLNPGALAGTAGTIFEAAISGILNDDDFKDYSKIDRNSLIDFPPFDAIKKLFGIKGGASKGLEAKATNSSDLISSAAGKFLKNAKGAEAFSGRGANVANALNKAVVASVGYIPNFALSLSQMKELRAAYGKKIIRQKNNNAFYSPSKDEIQVGRERPNPFFTALHEIGHATDNASGPEFKVIREMAKDRRFDMLTNKAYFANLALEVRANLQVVKALEKAKASQQDIEAYIQHAGHYIQGYLNAPGHQYIDTKKYGKVNKKDFVPYGTGEKLTGKSSFNFLEEVKELMRSAGKVGSRSARKTRSNAANGFIPNFADPLKEAIGREMSAGVPASQIYIDKNSSLKNSMNPMGLMVANRRDEPGGGMQGVSRARREGANPMTYGASRGFVPNFERRVGTGSRPPASLGGSGGGGGGGSDIEKPKRDLLGVIFAVQTGLSFLTGATSDATSGLGKFGNAVSSIASAATTVALVGQGLSGLAKEGGTASKVLGRIGIYGAIAAGAFEAFKQLASYLDSTNPSIQKTQSAMEGVAAAANKASINLENLNPSEKANLQKERSKFFEQEGVSQGFFTDLKNELIGSEKRGKPVTMFEGFGSASRENFTNIVAPASAVGISFKDLSEKLKALKEDGIITGGEIKNLGFELETIINQINKLSPENIIKKLGLTPDQGLGQTMAALSSEEMDDFIRSKGKFEGGGAKPIQDLLYEEGMKDDSARYRKIKEVKEAVVNYKAQEKEQEIVRVQTASLALLQQQLENRIAYKNTLFEATSAEEYSLELQKEMLSVGEKERTAAGYKLQALQDAKKLTLEQEKATLDVLKNSDLINKKLEGAGFSGQIDPAKFKEIAGITEEISDLIKQQGGYTQEVENRAQSLLTPIVKNKEQQELIISLLKESNSEVEKRLTLESRLNALSNLRTATLEAENFVYEKRSAAITNEYDQQLKLNELRKKDLDIALEKFKVGKERQKIGGGASGNLSVDKQILEQEKFTINAKLKIDQEDLLIQVRKTLSEAALQVGYKPEELSAISTATSQKEFETIVTAIEDAEKQAQKAKIQQALDEVKLKNNSAILQATTVQTSANYFLQTVKTAADYFRNNPLVQFLGGAVGGAEGTPVVTPEQQKAEQDLQAAQASIQSSTDAAVKFAENAMKGVDTLPKNFSGLFDVYPNAMRESGQAAEEASNSIGSLENALLSAGGSLTTFANLVRGVFTSLPETIAQNKFSMLTATDSQSIIGNAVEARRNDILLQGPASAGTIAQAADATAIYEKELEIKRAITAEDKINGEFELEKLKEILPLRMQLLEAETNSEREAIIDRIIAKEKQRLPVLDRIKAVFSSTTEQRAAELEDSLVNASVQFKDNLIDGISKAIEEGGSLGDILRSAALDFARAMTKASMNNLISSIFSFSNGGEVKNYASGGMINGGSGNKDDIPAMLMGGEYVIKKTAVKKYGPEFLDALNNGRLNGYAKGGQVEELPMQSGSEFYTPGTYGQGGIQGRENLLAFANQGYTSGQYDVMRSGDNFASINLEGESMRLTNFGRRTGPQAEAIRSAKLQAFDLYEQEIRQEEEWVRQKKEAEKQAKAQRKAMLVQIGLAVASSVASSAANSMMEGFKAGWAEAAAKPGATFSSKFAGGVTGIGAGGTINGVNVGGLGNWFSGVGNTFTGNFKEAGNYFKLSQIGSADQLQQAFASSTTNKTPFASFLQERGFSPNISSGSIQSSIGSNGILNWGGTGGDGTFIEPPLPVGDGSMDGYPGVLPPLPEDPSQWIRGGPSTALDSPPPLSVPVTRDSGVKDNWQRLLNKPYAIGGQIPNTGGVDTVPAMLSGGEFIMNRAASQNIGAGNLQALNAGASSLPTEEKTEELNDKLIAKLDELIATMTEGSGGAGSITINVDSNGKSTEETSGENSESNQKLAKQIKDTVIKVIEQEKRLGGKLRRGL